MENKLTNDEKLELINELAYAIKCWMNGAADWTFDYNGETFTLDKFEWYCGSFTMEEIVEADGSAKDAAERYVTLYY